MSVESPAYRQQHKSDRLSRPAAGWRARATATPAGEHLGIYPFAPDRSEHLAAFSEMQVELPSRRWLSQALGSAD